MWLKAPELMTHLEEIRNVLGLPYSAIAVMGVEADFENS